MPIFWLLTSVLVMLGCATTDANKPHSNNDVANGQAANVSCSGPDCAFLGIVGAAAAMANMDNGPSYHSESSQSSITINCRLIDELAVPFPCGATSVIVSSNDSQTPITLKFKGEVINITGLKPTTAYNLTISHAGITETKHFANLFIGMKKDVNFYLRLK